MSYCHSLPTKHLGNEFNKNQKKKKKKKTKKKKKRITGLPNTQQSQVFIFYMCNNIFRRVCNAVRITSVLRCFLLFHEPNSVQRNNILLLKAVLKL